MHVDFCGPRKILCFHMMNIKEFYIIRACSLSILQFLSDHLIFKFSCKNTWCNKQQNLNEYVTVASHIDVFAKFSCHSSKSRWYTNPPLSAWSEKRYCLEYNMDNTDKELGGLNAMQ